MLRRKYYINTPEMVRIIHINLFVVFIMWSGFIKGQTRISLNYNINNKDIDKIAFPISKNLNHPESILEYDSTYYSQTILKDTLYIVFEDIHHIDVNRDIKSYSSLREKITSTTFTQILEVKKRSPVIIIKSSGWLYYFVNQKKSLYNLTNYKNTNRVKDSIIIDYALPNITIHRKDYPKKCFSVFLTTVLDNDFQSNVYVDTVRWENGELLFSLKNSTFIGVNYFDWLFIGSSISTKEKMLSMEMFLNDYEKRKGLTIYTEDE